MLTYADLDRSAPQSTYTLDYPDRSVSLILVGDATVTPHTKGGRPLTLRPGDLLVIPEVLLCFLALLVQKYKY